jgi:hypothetical protein
LQHLQTRTADYFSNVIGTWARWMTFMATGREAGLEYYRGLAFPSRYARRFVVSWLDDRFRRLSGSDDALKPDSGRLSFSNRLFTGPIRRLQSGLAKLLPIAAPGRSMASMFCTLSSTSEVSEC